MNSSLDPGPPSTGAAAGGKDGDFPPLPGPTGLPFAGSLIDFFRDMPELSLRVARNHGDLATFRLGSRRVVLVSRPEWIGDILVTHSRNFVKSRGLQRAKKLLGEGLLTSEGAFHLRQRRLSQHAFHRSRMEHYSQIMIDCARSTRDRWMAAPAGEMDVVREMNRLTLEIVGKTLFDADVADQAEEVRGALSDVLEVFPLMVTPFGELFDRLPFGPAQRFLKARAKLDAVLYKVIEDRRESTGDRGDLLSMLLTATDDETDGSRMSDEQLRDELMTIFLAGHETTANALSWTWLLLSRNPEVERKLHQELDEALEGRDPRPADVDRLPYTRCVFAESMRIYPPAFILGRQNLETYRIGEYQFPPGTAFFMCPYVSHRDPRYFPDPERFDPERFRPAAIEQRPKFCYYPFGGGNRVCLGERFAWSEGILLLATLAQRFRLKLRPGFEVKHRASMVLRPRGVLPMWLTTRVLPPDSGPEGKTAPEVEAPITNG